MESLNVGNNPLKIVIKKIEIKCIIKEMRKQLDNFFEFSKELSHFIFSGGSTENRQDLKIIFYRANKKDINAELSDLYTLISSQRDYASTLFSEIGKIEQSLDHNTNFSAIELKLDGIAMQIHTIMQNILDIGTSAIKYLDAKSLFIQKFPK